MSEETPEIVAATEEERARVVDALVLAFVRDPLVRWTFRDPTAYRVGFGEFVLAFGGAALGHGTAFATGDFGAASLWLPPGVGPDEAGLAAVFHGHLDAERLALAGEMMEKMGACHPAEPHWYLPLIGVDPACQGRGLGSALLRHALARVDRERLPAYLESSNPANIPLYERHGFRLLDTLRVGDAPPMFPMLRPARGAS